VQLIPEDTMSTAAKIKLRHVLDKLAVNFYGADPVGRKR